MYMWFLKCCLIHPFALLPLAHSGLKNVHKSTLTVLENLQQNHCKNSSKGRRRTVSHLRDKMRLLVLPKWVKVVTMKSTLVKHLSFRRFLKKTKWKHFHPRMSVCKCELSGVNHAACRALCALFRVQIVHCLVCFQSRLKHCMSLIHILETKRIAV